MRLEIVDVFAEAPLEGNQLAVVTANTGLSDLQMQAIAREMNFSETTFVLSSSDERAQVRIFTPSHELPFAGHPTLGTAWVLGRDQESYVLDLKVGPVEVAFESEASGSGICWMSPPLPKTLDQLDPADAARLLNLSAEDLDTRYPPILIELGPQFVFIGLSEEQTLEKVSVNAAVLAELMANGSAASSIFVFCEAQRTDYAARMFFEAGGMREDPATGSANSAFAIYLRDVCGIEPKRLVVAQGETMLRPSRIYLDIHEDSYRVGGRVRSVLVGELAELT